MIVQSFASGSSGNAMIVRAGGAAVLIDCGLGPRVLARALKAHQLTLRDLDLVLITHEHDDHVRGLFSAAATGLRLRSTAGTARALGLLPDQHEAVAFGESLRIGTLEITPLATSHDAEEPCGYSLCDGVNRVTLLTDLGVVDDSFCEVLASSRLIVIEANHDLHMLKSGPYPAHLKRRVQSERGHLSNADCGAFLAKSLSRAADARTIWLAHLSATNNRPDLAVRTVSGALADLPARHHVEALPRGAHGPIWTPESVPSGTQLTMFVNSPG